MGRKIHFLHLFLFFWIFFQGLPLVAQEYSHADSLVEAKKFSEAIRIYEQAAADNPEDDLVQQKLQQAKALQKKAQENYAKALEQGQKHLSNKEYARAREAFKTALANKPDANYPAMKLQEIQRVYKDPQVEKAFEEAMNKAEELINNYRYEEALQEYQKALDIKPRNVEVLKKVKQVRSFIAKQQERDKDYQQLVANAESYYADGNYERAMMQYQEASLIKPDKNLPKNKIEKIRDLLQNEREKRKNYEAQIAIADSLYMEKQFEKAKQAYKEALLIKPSETYPVNMISKIDPALADQESLNPDYLKTIEQADLALRINDYEEALSLYQEALRLNPGEAYPEKQIKEVKAQISGEQQKRNQQYDSLIAEADDFFDKDNYQQALATYREAQQVAPEKAYPGQRISAINEITRKRNQQQEKYHRLIASADSAFSNEMLEEARSRYQEAVALFADSTYPKKQLAAIDSRIASQQKRRQQYDSLIAEADDFFDNKDFNRALSLYQDAKELIPEDGRANQRIATVEDSLTIQEQKELAYEKAIGAADSLYQKEEYQKAITQYQEAQKIFSGRNYPADRISKSMDIMANQREENKMYSRVIKNADSLFNEKKYRNAISSYNEALEIKPEDAYAKNQIAQAKKLLQEREEAFSLAMAQGVNQFEKENYQQALNHFNKALTFKPGNDQATERRNETQKVLEQLRQEMMKQYNAVIAEADKSYENKDLSKAIEKYEEAERINPDADYPGEMITKIREYLAEHSLREIVNQTVTVKGNTEKKFSFQPLTYRDRANNFIVITAKRTDASAKVFLNYGAGEQKHGGVVISGIPSGEARQFVFNLANHRRWQENENNWITVYVQGGDIAISALDISKGD